MAKKTSETLLQEVVGQLRQLNRSSVRDQLREAEVAKRQESLMGQGEVQEEQQSTIIDGAQDFQRRFLAGQAKTFTDKTLQEKGAKLKPQEDLNLLMKHHYEATLSMARDMAMLASHGSTPGSLYVHDIGVKDSIGEVLAFDEQRAKDLDRHRKDDLRSQIENRREGRGGGMGQFGMLGGAAAGGGGLGMEMLDAAEGGGWFKNFAKGIRQNAWLAAPLLLFQGVRSRLFKVGTLLFKPFSHLGGIFKNKKMLSNPKNWRGMVVQGIGLAALAVWSGMFDDETQGPHSDTFDNSEMDLDPGESGGWWSNIGLLDAALYTWMGWDAYKLGKWSLKTKVGLVLQGLMKKAWGGLTRGAVGFWLMRAAQAAGMFAVGVGAAVSWPVWVAVLGAGVAWWQWDNIMEFLAGKNDEGIAQITTPTGLEQALYAASELKKFKPDFDTLESQTMIKAQEAQVANLIASVRDNADYRDQVIQALINGGWTNEDLKRLGQMTSAVLGDDGLLIPGTSEYVNLIGQNRLKESAYLIDEHIDKNQVEKAKKAKKKWSENFKEGSALWMMNHQDAIRMNKLNDERKKLGFNKNGIKTFEPLTLASLDSDNRPMMLSPITDAKRIDNSTSKVINNHFHYNRSIPFGQGEEIQQNGPWVYSV